MSGEKIELEGGAKRRFTPPRFLLLACVLLGTVWAFSLHFENLADRIAQDNEIVDETGTLPPGRVALMRDASRAMREKYGVTLRVLVRSGPVTAPPEDPKTLFIGLDTASSTAVISIPPLMARALPAELAARLQSGYFDPYFAAGAWPEGLYSCVLSILEALDDKR
ncbi:MAG: hypothetical protein ACOZEN_06075 [Thermodesulfobacteriota bacterium]